MVIEVELWNVRVEMNVAIEENFEIDIENVAVYVNLGK